MEAIPRNDGEQYRFDAFCKAVLRNEARNYHRNKKRLLDREKSFSVLSLEELGQLTSVDHYPSEEFVFSSYGCDLHIVVKGGGTLHGQPAADINADMPATPKGFANLHIGKVG